LSGSAPPARRSGETAAGPILTLPMRWRAGFIRVLDTRVPA
jgi:hypothetical protein